MLACVVPFQVASYVACFVTRQTTARAESDTPRKQTAFLRVLRA